jgi:hypothetical protein
MVGEALPFGAVRGGLKRLGMVAALAIAMVALASAGSAAGRGGGHAPKGPTPGKHLAAMIEVHNAFVTEVADEFEGEASNYSIELEHCHNVEATSGEARPEAERALRDGAERNVKLVEDAYMAYNRDVARWADEAAGWGGGLSKKARKQLKAAVQLLRLAHAAHEKEFFHMRGIWVAMETANCATAEEEKQETSLAGTTGWIKDFKGLRALAEILHVKKPNLEFGLGPYLG